MADWADVGLALAGAPVGAAIAVFGIHLTNKSNREAQGEQLKAAREHQSEAERLRLRDTAYSTVIPLANKLHGSIKPTQDYGNPDRETMEQMLSHETELMLYAPADVADAMVAFHDRCEELLTVLHGGYPIAYTHRGAVDTRDMTEEEAHSQAVMAYRALVNIVRIDLGLNQLTWPPEPHADIPPGHDFMDPNRTSFEDKTGEAGD